MATALEKTNRQELITRSIDKNVTANLTISREAGGTQFRTMAEVMDFAKLMSVSKQAVPPHCREQVGVCLGITIQAIEWMMSPFAVANKSYVVNDRLGYESQLIHAVIEQRAPITARLRHEFFGEGAKRRCRVWATAKGESEPLEYTSPEFGTITPKNSPLWKTKPDLQLYYNTSRDWARVFFPDVILGVYSTDELEAAAMTGTALPAESGIAGLKARLLPTIETVSEDAEIEPPHEDADAGDDASQETTPAAVEMTPEEIAEYERERKTKGGKLFEASEQYE